MGEVSQPDRPAVAGEKLGVSDWYTIRQSIVDAFGGLTEDLEPLHNDPEWCKANSPYGTTIAFGFLTLSMFTKWLHEVSRGRWSGRHDRLGFPINYGFNRTRLVSPVKVGSRVRAHIAVKDEAVHASGNTLYTFDVSIEIENEERPALVSDWLLMWVDGGPLRAAGSVG